MDWDVVVVAYPGLNAVWLAWMLFPGMIVYDAFFSFYQSEVEDRGSTSPGSLRAWLLFASEWVTLRLARVILLDTWAHVDYFSRTYGVRKRRFIRVPIGADDAIFSPGPAPRAEQDFIAEFHGTFIPLQGVQIILEAAKLLEPENDIHFRLTGGGQTFKEMRTLAEKLTLRNVDFLGSLPQTAPSGDSVISELRKADVVLGIFGTGRKTDMVVPNKVYEGLACAKPVVTAETAALRELLDCGHQALCVPPGDSRALADALLRLKGDPVLRHSLGQAGHRAYKMSFAPTALARGLIRDLERVGVIDAPAADR
jgi:glycosyltransferase involved in cell wall biosynthesis